MTITVKQLTGSDCVLACIAMLLDKASVLDCFTLADVDEVVASKGVADFEPWFNKVGMTRRTDYQCIHLHGLTDYTMDDVKRLIWKRKAILSVKSLNNEDGMHAIYWDGQQIHDPSTQRTYLHLSSVQISKIHIFAS